MDVSMMGNMNPFMGQMAGMGSRPDPGRMFSKVDKNGDGGLDQSEFQTVADKIRSMTSESMDVEEIFSTYDTDQDGVLSQEEAKSAMEAHKPSGPPFGGMVPPGMMGMISGMGNFNSDMLGIEQYEQVAGMGEPEDPISSLLEALSEEDDDDESHTESLFSIDMSA